MNSENALLPDAYGSGAAPPSAIGRPDVIAACSDMAAAEDADLGRCADSPLDIPWHGWKRVMRRTAREMVSDRVSLVAAGCAFYGTLALFPAISMLLSIYGLVFDPVTIEPHLVVLQDLLPPAAFTLISQRVHELVNKPQATLTASLLVSVAIALWSSATGTKSILSALNVAYEERERRSFLQFQVTAFSMTLIALVGAVARVGAGGRHAGRVGAARDDGLHGAAAAGRQSRRRVDLRDCVDVAAVPVRPQPGGGEMAVDHPGIAGRDPAMAGGVGACSASTWAICPPMTPPMDPSGRSSA